MKEEFFVMLPKYDKGYSNAEMFILALVQGLDNKLGKVILTFGDLIDYCGVAKTNQSTIVEALKSLESKGHLKVTFDGESKNSKVIIEEIDPKVEKGKGHIQIYVWELKVFLKDISKTKVISMFNQFVFIVDFINMGEKYRKISFPKLLSICDIIGKSERTVRNYNEELEHNQLLYTKNLVIDNETVKKVYSRFKDKADVDEAIAEAVSNKTKRIEILRKPIEKGTLKKESTKQSSGKVDSEALSRVKRRMEGKGLDFNPTLSGKINDLIFKFKDSKADAVEIVIYAIEKILKDAANIEIKSKNALVMSKLKDEKLLKAAEDCMIKQINFVESTVNRKPIVDYAEEYAKTQRLVEQERPQNKYERMPSLTELWGESFLDDDEWAS